MAKYRFLPILLVVGLLLGWTGLVMPGRAQVANLDEIQKAAIGLTALPPRLGDDGSLTGGPGETIQTQVRVRNTANRSLQVRTLIEDFVIDKDGKTPIPIGQQIDSRFSLASWMSLPLSETLVPAGGIYALPIIIHVPDNARPGGRYAMVMHQPLLPVTPDQAANSQAAVNQRVGTLVYFRVPGEVQEEAMIRNLTIPAFTELGPVPISFDVENLSDVHIRPASEITIRNWWGQTVAVIRVDSQNVFPYSLRRFETKWQRVWGWGRYTAHWQVAYGEQGKVATAMAAFWLFPYRLVLILLIAGLVLSAIATLLRRHYRRHQAIEQQHVELLEDRIKQLEYELHQQDSH